MVPAVAGLVHDGIGDRGVERLADGVDALEPLLLERSQEGTHDRLDLVARSVDARGIAGVEDGQEALDERAQPALHVFLCPALGLLLEVLEVGLGATPGVEELVALGGHPLEVGDQRLEGHLGWRISARPRVEELALDDDVVEAPDGVCLRVGHRPTYAWSASSMISASTTSSSDGCEAPAPAPPPASRSAAAAAS